MECFECGKPAKHEHHVVPKTLGGTKTIPLCEECHSKVHGKDLHISRLQLAAVKNAIIKFKDEGKQWGGGGWNRTTNEICDQIRELRASGKKLKEISSVVGISVTTIGRILKGTLHTTEKHKHY